MNQSSNRRRRARGFTLVELLVVIAIIAVLAAMGFAGAQAAINKAKRTKATNVCVGMDRAVMGFYDDYGHLPVMGNNTSDKEFVTNSGEGVELLTVLVAAERDSNDMENPKKVRYFEAPEAKSRRDGIAYAGSGNTPQGLFDPWGEPYRVVLDGNYDGLIDNPLGTGQIRGRMVVTYTFGKNKKNDKGGGDDVKSW